MGRLLAAALLSAAAAGCTGEPPDDALACSIASADGWRKAYSPWNPQGVKARRLSPEDSARMRDSRLWRPLAPSAAFTANPGKACSTTTRDVGELAVSRDGLWARATFRSPNEEEMCLARREGTLWVERECEITMISDPII